MQVKDSFGIEVDYAKQCMWCMPRQYGHEPAQWQATNRLRAAEERVSGRGGNWRRGNRYPR